MRLPCDHHTPCSVAKRTLGEPRELQAVENIYSSSVGYNLQLTRIPLPLAARSFNW